MKISIDDLWSAAGCGERHKQLGTQVPERYAYGVVPMHHSALKGYPAVAAAKYEFVIDAHGREKIRFKIYLEVGDKQNKNFLAEGVALGVFPVEDIGNGKGATTLETEVRTKLYDICERLEQEVERIRHELKRIALLKNPDKIEFASRRGPERPGGSPPIFGKRFP